MEPIKSLKEYMTHLEEINKNNKVYLYRGQIKIDEKKDIAVKSSALRYMKKSSVSAKEMIDFHNEIYYEVNKFSRHKEKPHEVFAKFQHDGGATALLDFSHSALIALYFACLEKENSEVYMIGYDLGDNTSKISHYDLEKIEKTEDLFNLLKIKEEKNFDISISNSDIDNKKLITGRDYYDYIIWEPYPSIHNRIMSQYSVFVISFSEIIPLEKIEISNNHKRKILKELSSYTGIKHETIFNDYQGYCKKKNECLDITDLHSLYVNGKYNEVIQEAKKIIVSDIDNKEKIEALLYSGSSNNFLMNFEEAIADFQKVIDLESTNFLAHYNMGILNTELKNYKKAIKYFDKSLDLNPNNSEAYFERGNTNFDLNKNQKAIKDYDKAIELNENYFAAYYNRGLLKTLLGKIDDAMKDFDNAIKLNPNDSASYTKRGNLKFKLNKYDDAMLDYNKAISLDATSAEAYCNRGVIKFHLKKYNEAIEDYEITIKLIPNSSLAYSNTGEAFYELGNYEKTIANCKQAIKFNNMSEEAHFNLGRAFYKINEIEKAEKEFNIAIELDEKFKEKVEQFKKENKGKK